MVICELGRAETAPATGQAHPHPRGGCDLENPKDFNRNNTPPGRLSLRELALQRSDFTEGLIPRGTLDDLGVLSRDLSGRRQRGHVPNRSKPRRIRGR